MLSFKYSGNGVKLTKGFESCRLVAYQDIKGVWTIGWGHTGPEVVAGLRWTQEQADAALTRDYGWAEREINVHVAYAINQAMFDAMVDLTYNIGAGSFDHSTLLTELNRGDLEGAAKQFEAWSHASGKVVAGLLRRRLAEEKMFRDGVDELPKGIRA